MRHDRTTNALGKKEEGKTRNEHSRHLLRSLIQTISDHV